MPVEKLPSGKWRAVAHLGGHRVRGPWRATRREALDEAAELLRKLHDELGTVKRRRTAPPVRTVAELVDRFIEGQTYSPTTLRNITAARKRLPDDFVARTVTEIEPDEVEAVYARLRADGVKPSGVRRVHELLHAAWVQGERWRWVRYNPVHAARAPQPPSRRMKIPDAETMTKLLAAVNYDPKFAAYVRLSVATGARRGEVMALRWGDLDLEAATVVVARAVIHTPKGGTEVKSTKTGNVRVISLDAGTVSAVKRWRAAAGGENLAAVAAGCYLFGWLDRPRNPDWATTRWKRLADREGHGTVRLHDLRHYMASDMIADGVDVVTVANRLGHRTPRTTLSVYSHALPAADRAAADRFGRRLG